MFEFGINFHWGYLGHLILGPLLLLIGLILRKYPPQKINHLYGYRTKRSMVNQDTWDYANKFANDLFIRICYLIIAFQLVTILVFSYDMSLLVSTGFEIIAIITTIPLTENKLKEIFNDEGERNK